MDTCYAKLVQRKELVEVADTPKERAWLPVIHLALYEGEHGFDVDIIRTPVGTGVKGVRYTRRNGVYDTLINRTVGNSAILAACEAEIPIDQARALLTMFNELANDDGVVYGEDEPGEEGFDAAYMALEKMVREHGEPMEEQGGGWGGKQYPARDTAV